MLGGDGDGLGVGDGDGDVFVGAVVAVGGLEGARAVALDRAFGEEVDAALDEVGAAAGVDVEAIEEVGGVDALAADQGHHQRRPDDPDRHRGQRPPPAPADRGEDGEAGQQGDEAGLGEGLCQAEPKDGDEDGQQGEGAAFPHPEQRRHRDHDHQRQVAPVDVRVPEDRVDPEVGVEFVRANHLVVPEQTAGQVLDRAEQDERRRLDPDDDQHQGQQPPVPLGLTEQPVGHRERHQEEAGVLQPLREVARVQRLNDVQDDDRGKDSRQPAGGRWDGRGVLRAGQTGSVLGLPSGAARRRGRPVSGEESQYPGGDHQVEGDEEVGGVAAGVQGHPEGERGDDRQRQQDRPAAEGPGQQPDGDRGADQQHHEPGLVVTQGDDLRRVPLVAEDQQREEADRCEHRQRARTARRQQDRGRAGPGGDQQAGGGEQLAQGATPLRLHSARGRSGGRCRWIVPGRTRVRPWPSSFTRSL